MRWMWIDRVIELDPGRRMVAVKSVSLAEDYLHQHFAASAERPAAPVMPASLIIEGMAQTAGILIGHAESFREKVILAKISRAQFDFEAVPGTTLRYTAEVERLDEIGASTMGRVDLLDHARAAEGFREMGRIDLMFSHLDRNQGAAGASGESFPAHNFVFGESFKTLLRGSGIEFPSA